MKNQNNISFYSNISDSNISDSNISNSIIVGANTTISNMTDTNNLQGPSGISTLLAILFIFTLMIVVHCIYSKNDCSSR